MQKSDWWCGLAIILISLFFIWGSLAMPWSDKGFDWSGAPGLTPLVLAIFLGITGIILMVRSRTNPKFYEQLEKSMAPPVVEEDDDSIEEEEPVGGELPAFLKSEKIRVALVILLCAIYTFILLGRFHYIAATAVFVAAFILVFRGAGWLQTGIIAVLVGVCVWLVFQQGFGVFLP
ncbi:MAG: hypothetical protein GX047_08450 [Firmicutes bacterium]|jgi:hypothetical protein|nr:hypothetical protein [Bacillota bacterium]